MRTTKYLYYPSSPESNTLTETRRLRYRAESASSSASVTSTNSAAPQAATVPRPPRVALSSPASTQGVSEAVSSVGVAPQPPVSAGVAPQPVVAVPQQVPVGPPPAAAPIPPENALSAAQNAAFARHGAALVEAMALEATALPGSTYWRQQMVDKCDRIHAVTAAILADPDSTPQLAGIAIDLEAKVAESARHITRVGGALLAGFDPDLLPANAGVPANAAGAAALPAEASSSSSQPTSSSASAGQLGTRRPPVADPRPSLLNGYRAPGLPPHPTAVSGAMAAVSSGAPAPAVDLDTAEANSNASLHRANAEVAAEQARLDRLAGQSGWVTRSRIFVAGAMVATAVVAAYVWIKNPGKILNSLFGSASNLNPSAAGDIFREAPAATPPPTTPPTNPPGPLDWKFRGWCHVHTWTS